MFVDRATCYEENREKSMMGLDVGQRGGSVVKIANCSFRGPKPGSQHLCYVTHSYL